MEDSGRIRSRIERDNDRRSYHFNTHGQDLGRATGVDWFEVRVSFIVVCPYVNRLDEGYQRRIRVGSPPS